MFEKPSWVHPIILNFSYINACLQKKKFLEIKKKTFHLLSRTILEKFIQFIRKLLICFIQEF